MTSTSRLMPVGSLTSAHHFDALDADSYTAHRLKHASPEHLHITTRRFFIGPIPEGWLNSNRKSWYRRRLELSTYSSRKASFNAAAGGGPHQRTGADLEGPSTAARMSFSFPQPEDVNDEPSETSEGETTQVDETEDDSEDEGRETVEIEPVATDEVSPRLHLPEDSDEISPKTGRTPQAVDGPSDPSRLRPQTSKQGVSSKTQASRDATPKVSTENDDLKRSPSNRDSLLATTPDNVETSSKTPLLQQEHSPSPSMPSAQSSKFAARQSMAQFAPAPMDAQEATPELGRANTGVRFKVTEGLANRQHRMGKRVDFARDKVANRRYQRNTLREGTIVKMEKMLVRVDLTQQPVPDEFDENESFKLETRTVEKWGEFMVVARKSKKQDADDFRLQIYKTRVIPEIDDDSSKKKPTREVRLDPKTTHVNLYSSLDKSVVLWHPYKKGTRIILMRPSSTAHSVEWYTFLRDAMGWQRPTTLRVNVPDLDVTLRLDRPFEGLEAAVLEAKDEETALARTVQAERAVAGRIVSRCLEMLRDDPEWSSVMETWNETAKMGLAWKRYDRLEWVHGAAEQKMYGTMAMQHSHDLELRPKQHYPTTTYGRKGVQHEEPAPIEGFLIRLTSQKGIHQRMGKTFFKRLYFYTQNQFLMFARPAKATPPHPPRLATIGGSNIPSSHEIVEKTPETYDVEPFKTREGAIPWLSSGDTESNRRHDRDAFEEARRTLANLTESDGYVNMCGIRKVRKMHWGASPIDDALEAGSDSDVDFHEDVQDSRQDDGTTNHVDDDRVFELVLDNDLIVRLQAYSRQSRDEWMQRLRKLVKIGNCALAPTRPSSNLFGKRILIDSISTRRWKQSLASSDASGKLVAPRPVLSCITCVA
jgi:Sporulation protein family 7